MMANWMRVRVTGNLKTMKIDLPVLDERAEEKYHRQHKETTGGNGERLSGSLVAAPLSTLGGGTHT